MNGRAVVKDDADLLDSFAVDGKPPRSVLVITLEANYFQCARAIVRSALWDPASHVPRENLPTPGEILSALSDGKVGGADYDEAWPERARRSLW